MAQVHVVLNQKGGVGKSTLTINLAAVTAEVLDTGDPDSDSPVAAVSIDPQGSAIWWADRLGDRLPFDIVQAHDDIPGLAKLRFLPGKEHIFVDTPGWVDLTDVDPAGHVDGGDPLGTSDSAEALRTVLDNADHVIVPMLTEPLSFDPTARTINKVVQPRGLPFTVVLNNWDPRDGKGDLEQTKGFVRANGWPLANTTVRKYRLHARAAADGLVVTEYPANRVALQARQDFDKLALELSLNGKGGR